MDLEAGLIQTIGRQAAEVDKMRGLVAVLQTELSATRSRLRQSERQCHTLIQTNALTLLHDKALSEWLPDGDTEGAPAALLLLESLLMHESHRRRRPAKAMVRTLPTRARLVSSNPQAVSA